MNSGRRTLAAIAIVGQVGWGCGGAPGGAIDGGYVDALASSDATHLPGVDGGDIDAVDQTVDDPGAAGPLDWSQDSHQVTVGSDTVPVTVYLPDGAGPFPVLVFSHGFMLDPSLYQSYGEQLASWGYLVVMPALPGSILAPRTHRELAEILIGLLDWIDDNAELADGPLGGAADVDRLALAGHSMGGKISLLVATQDDRPRAVFGVDPVDAAGGPGSTDSTDYPSVTPELMPQIAVPLVLLGETTNASGGLGQPCAPADNNFHQYYLYAASPAVEIEVLGANHMSFLDDPNCGLTCSACPAGTDDPAATRHLTQRYLTAFLELVLRDRQGYRSFLAGAEMDQDVADGLVLTESKNSF